MCCIIVRDEHGFTPLHWAAIAGYMNLVELLLVKGARMDITNMGGDTPLHSAVAHGRKDIIAKVAYTSCSRYNCTVCCGVDAASESTDKCCQRAR